MRAGRPTSGPPNGLPTPVRSRASTGRRDARRNAVDPSQNVVLEASAGTGKTRVLVERYVNLLRAGIEPDHILADHVHAQGRGRDAAADHRAAEGSEPPVRVRRGALARSQGASRRHRRSRRSTRSACRCCVSFRSRPTSIPASTWRTTTEVPRLVGESLDQAFRICRGVARDDDDVALVFAQLGERRLRGGIAALLDRRLVAPHALRRFLQKGPREMTAQSACVACRRAAAPCLQRRARRPRRVPRRRRVAPSAVCDAGGRRARARGSASRDFRGPRRASGISCVDRSPARVFPHPGRPPARRALRRHRLYRRAVRQPGRVEAAPRQQPPRLRRGRARHPRFPPRSERRHVARRLADLRGGDRALPAHARVARAARFLRRARARCPAAERAGRVLREPAAAGSAAPPCARRRVPGHEPCAVGAGAAARAQLGRRVWRRERRAAALHLHRRRPEAVDLRLSRCGRHGRRRSGGLHRRIETGRRAAAGDYRQLPIGAGDSDVRQRGVRRDRRG